MKSTIAWLIAVGLALATLRCTPGEGPVQPPPRTPGVLTLVVQSPNGAEGAALLDIAGGAVTSVTSSGTAVYTAPEGSRIRILLVRAAAGELSAEVAVSDTAANLDSRLVQVAGPSSELRPSLAAYAIEVRR